MLLGRAGQVKYTGTCVRLSKMPPFPHSPTQLCLSWDPREALLATGTRVVTLSLEAARHPQHTWNIGS